MKYLKKYEYTTTNDQLNGEFICNITKKIFFNNTDIKPDISFWIRRGDELSFEFKMEYVNDALFKNLNNFWDALMIKDRKIISITQRRVGFYFSIDVSNLGEIFKNLKEFSTDEKTSNEIEQYIIKNYLKKYNL